MKILDALFGKTKAKFGLATHFFSSKHYAKDIRKIAKRLHRILQEQKKYQELTEEGSQERMTFKVTKGSINFFKSCKEELESISLALESMYTLEYRLEKGINDIINSLDKLQHTEEIFKNEELKKAFEDLREVFRQVNIEFKKTSRDQKLKMQDLLRDRNYLRDRSWKSDSTIIRKLRWGSKKEKREVVRVAKVLGNVEAFIDYLEKGKINPEKVHSRVKTANKNLNHLKKEIIKELELFYEINYNITILLERLKGDEEKIHNIINQLKNDSHPLPSVAQKIILPKMDELRRLHEEDERKQYNRARLIKSQAA